MRFNTALQLDTRYVPDAGVPARTDSALAALWAVLEAPGIGVPHRRELLSVGIWKYTEAVGCAPHAKYRLPYRTAAAMDMSTQAAVQHEHVWTRKWIIDKLLPSHADGWGRRDQAQFMAQYGVACVVTKEEHARLNAHPSAEGWARYAKARVTVCDAVTGRPIDLAPQQRDVSDIPAVQTDAALESVALAELAPLDDTVLAALKVNWKQHTPHLQAFIERAREEDVDLIIKRNADGVPQTYIRLYDAQLEELTPTAVFINYNGTLDFRLKEADVPDLMALRDVSRISAEKYQVRCTLSGADSVDTGLQLLYRTLDGIRAA